MAGKIEDRQAVIESRSIKVNEHQVHYLTAGSGPPVVLIHGGASDSRDWVDTMTALAHRYTLYAPDLIGFGQNYRNRDGYYLSDFRDSILAFIDTIKLEKPALVGHSFGARVCMDVAFQNHELVRKLVLVDASGLGKVSRFGSSTLTVFWALRKLLRRPQPYPKFLVKEGDNYDQVSIDELARLTAPTLLIWKRYDPYLPLSIARRVVKLIPGARLEVIPGYGHAPHQQNSAAFNRLLLDFLDHD